MPDAAAFQQAFGALLAGREGPVADAALARALTVHRNTATKAAEEALAANYPVVRALVGDEPFGACALAFVEAQPPASPRLCVFGEGFADFLAAWPPFAELAAYLPDVARVERAGVEALFARDAEALDGGALAAGVDPQARLAPHPAARLVAAISPAAAIWLAHQDGGEGLEEVEWAEEVVLVTRPEGRVLVSALSPAAVAFAAAIVAGGARGVEIGTAAEAAAEAGDVAEAFATLLTAGALLPVA